MCGNRSWLIRPGEINHLHTECADCVHGGRSLFISATHKPDPHAVCEVQDDDNERDSASALRVWGQVVCPRSNATESE